MTDPTPTPIAPVESSTPTAPDVATALSGMVEARRTLEQRVQALHDLLAPALAHAMQPGDVIAHGLPGHPDVHPVVYLRRMSAKRGRSYDAKAFEVATVPTLTIDPNNLNGCEWRCEAVPISSRTGQPMSARAGGKFNADHRSTVTLVGQLADGFEGVVCASDDPAAQIVAFAATFRNGRPDVTAVRQTLEARDEARRRSVEAETLRRTLDDPDGFVDGVYLGPTPGSKLRGPGLV